MARPKMPETIKVGAHVYNVIRIAPTQHIVKGDECLGSCNPDTNTIRITKGLRFTIAQQTLWHEVMHAATPALSYDKRQTDEAFITATAPILTQVLKDNPDLVEYVTYIEG